MTIDKPGVYQMTAAEYHADPCPEPSLSSSIAKKLIYECAELAWFAHPQLNPNWKPVNKTEFDLGTAGHSSVLDGKCSPDDFAIYDGVTKDGKPVTAWQSKSAKEFRQQAWDSDITPLFLHQFDRVQDMVESVRMRLPTLDLDPGEPEPFTDGEPEVCLIWQEQNGVWCRALLDWKFNDNLRIDDLKTTQVGMDERSLTRHIWNMHYQIQHGFYCLGMNRVFGTNPDFRFIFANMDAPNLVASVQLDSAGAKLGELQSLHAIKLWGEHLESGDWPAFANRTVRAETPGYELANWDLKMGTDGGIYE